MNLRERRGVDDAMRCLNCAHYNIGAKIYTCKRLTEGCIHPEIHESLSLFHDDDDDDEFFRELGTNNMVTHRPRNFPEVQEIPTPSGLDYALELAIGQGVYDKKPKNKRKKEPRPAEQVEKMDRFKLLRKKSKSQQFDF